MFKGASTSMARNVCTDKMKYLLLNAIRESPVSDRLYVSRRTMLYKNFFRMVQENQKMPKRQKADHLYVILYSKYCTTRYIISQTEDEDIDEDDEHFKQSFRDLLEKKFINAKHLETGYLEIIKQMKSPEMYKTYEILNDTLQTIPEQEKDIYLFSAAMSETDIYLEKKLGADVDKFIGWRGWTLRQTYEFRVVSGWITAGGVGFLGCVWFPLVLMWVTTTPSA